jgi:ketosteroid isomerase-like protein
MSQENVEVLRRCFDLANDGDLDAVADLYDENAVLHAIEGWPEPGPWYGRAAILGEFRRLWEDFVEGKLEITEIDDHNDWVLVKGVWHVQGYRSRVGGTFANTLAARLRSGKIVEARYYWDHAEALKAAGLAE